MKNRLRITCLMMILGICGLEGLNTASAGVDQDWQHYPALPSSAVRLRSPLGTHEAERPSSSASECPTFRKTMLGVVSWRCSYLEESTK